MPRLKIHFDGWLSLPPHFRQQLGLHSGDEVEAELVDGTIVLRPAKAVQEGMSAEATEAVPAPSVLAAEVQDTEQPATTSETPPTRKRRGRPPKARPVGG